MGEPVAIGGLSRLYAANAVNPELIERVNGNRMLLKAVALNARSMQEKAHRMFMQELALTYQFHNNPHVVQMYGWCEEPAGLLLKRYVLGDLREFVRGRGMAPQCIVYCTRTLLTILRHVASALTDVHGRGFVHCDVKSANVFLEMDYRREVHAALGDFGIARILEATALASLDFKVANVNGLSMAYAAPECIKRLKVPGFQTVDPQVWKAGDVYALAVVVSEMLNRELWSKPRVTVDVSVQKWSANAVWLSGGQQADVFKENPLYTKHYDLEAKGSTSRNQYNFPGSNK
jgi:serine/threonine protein kinase